MLLLSQANVLHLLHLKDLAMIDLPNERGLGDNDQIGVYFHLHYAVDRLYLQLLNMMGLTFLKLEVLASLGIFLQET